MFRRFLLLTLLVLPTLVAAQDIYKYKDEKGQWKFSNAPPADLQHQGTIAPVPGPDCTPFKIGEARRLSSSALRQSYPLLEIVSFELKLLDLTPGPRSAAQSEWRLQMRERKRDANLFREPRSQRALREMGRRPRRKHFPNIKVKI